MINTKRFFFAATSGDSITMNVQRTKDGFYLQSSDGSFSASPDPITMNESMTGGFSWDENRFAWDDGVYDVVFYDGGVSSANTGYEFSVVQDQIMNQIALVALAAKTAVSQIAGGLKLINNTIAELSKSVSLLQGQVNDIDAWARRSNNGT